MWQCCGSAQPYEGAKMTQELHELSTDYYAHLFQLSFRCTSLTLGLDLSSTNGRSSFTRHFLRLYTTSVSNLLAVSDATI